MMNSNNQNKLITCIVSVGVSKPIMAVLYEKFNLLQMQFSFARGIGKRSHLATEGWDEHAEKEIFRITVNEDLADDVFNFLFYACHMDKPHHGIIYMQSIYKASTYTLPEGLKLEL